MTNAVSDATETAATSINGQKWHVLFVLGPPGSGKGTQCAKLVEVLPVLHLSAGELLRNERSKPDAAHFAIIDEHFREGRMVPAEITCTLLEQAMETSRDVVSTFLIDGFPPDRTNLLQWEKQLGGKTNLLRVLHFDCSNDICKDRCLKRGQHRSDDYSSRIDQRLVYHKTQTMPILERFEKGKLLRRINAGLSIDEVFTAVRDALLNCFPE